MMSIDVSIIIPAYNEASRISNTLSNVLAYLKQQPWTAEVIVVNDGSTDDTSEKVRAFPRVQLLEHHPNKGKGAAVKSGMLFAKGKFRLFSDADLSTPIEELGRFLALTKEADIIIASRSLPGSVLRIPSPWHRRFLGRIFSWIVQLLILPGFKDTQCGFKLFTEQAAKTVFTRQRLDGFAFDVDLLYIARKHGFRIKEIPVTWSNAEGSKVSWRDPFRMLGQVLKIRWNAWTGRYA